nr:hypothetical protein [Tanacetum cinerariifolium]
MFIPSSENTLEHFIPNNEEGQLEAVVDGNKVLITESTIIRDLQLEDAEGVDCLPNAVIFEQLTLMRKQKSRKTKRKVTERAATTATSLDAEQDSVTSLRPNPKQHLMSQAPKGLIQVVVLGAKKLLLKLGLKEYPKISNDPMLAGVNTSQSGEDSLKLTELIELCTKLQQRVFDFEITKTTQALEIESLKRIVKKLEMRKRSRTPGLKRLYKVGLSTRLKSSEDKGFDGDEVIVEDAEMLVDVADDLRGKEVFVSQEFPLKKVSIVDEVNAVSTATTRTAT